MSTLVQRLTSSETWRYYAHFSMHKDTTMAMGVTQAENRPQKGSIIKVEPIREVKVIQRIKRYLAHKPRDLALFVLGINSGLRANELLSIQLKDVMNTGAGDVLKIRENKTGKVRQIILNETATDALTNWIVSPENKCVNANDYLFQSLKADVLTVSTLSRMVKKWCAENGLKGNYASHTLRKTWAFFQRKNGTPIPVLMVAMGHSTQRQTLEYMCVQDTEISDLYAMEL